MKILAIETSGSVGGVALCEEETVLARYVFPEGARHARSIMPAVDRVVTEAGLDKDGVDAVAVTDGPGSFTGLRVGVTCAKTLAWALGWQLVGVPTLELLANNVSGDAGFATVCPTLDARRERVYGAVFRLKDGRWADTTGVLVETPEGLAARLPAGTLVFGTGVRAYPEVLSGDGLSVGDDALAQGRAEVLARLGLARLREGGGCDPTELVPKYYRLTACEENLEGETTGAA
jgi:tRNA threonylcarbamoyladenosine biosynthesis protein TsaB